MSETPRLPEPRASQEIREILERHEERTSNVAPIVSIGESLMEHFNNFTRREIADIQRQLETVQPWFPASEEETQLRDLRVSLKYLVIGARLATTQNLGETTKDFLRNLINTWINSKFSLMKSKQNLEHH